MNNCFSIYHTSWITSGPKSNLICDNIPTKAILFFAGCSEVNSTWLITSELANQRARKVLFTCVVYTNLGYSPVLAEEYSWILFGHMTCLHQSGASENIWWIIRLLIRSKRAPWLVNQLWLIVPVNPWKKSRVLILNYCIKAKDHKEEHSKNTWITHLRLVIYEFFSCYTNIPSGSSAYKPQKLVVFCLNKPWKLVVQYLTIFIALELGYWAQNLCPFEKQTWQRVAKLYERHHSNYRNIIEWFLIHFLLTIQARV